MVGLMGTKLSDLVPIIIKSDNLVPIIIKSDENPKGIPIVGSTSLMESKPDKSPPKVKNSDLQLKLSKKYVLKKANSKISMKLPAKAKELVNLTLEPQISSAPVPAFSDDAASFRLELQEAQRQLQMQEGIFNNELSIKDLELARLRQEVQLLGNRLDNETPHQLVSESDLKKNLDDQEFLLKGVYDAIYV
jgi:hypothetical protein